MKVRVASAGTGKTTSLVLRYLELIASGTPLRRIAGVTFTRVAADELRQRVGSAVHQLLISGSYLGQDLPAGARPAFKEAARELEGATLTTIHGFMIAALRLVAPQMGLDPDFTVLGEWEAQAMFEEEMRSLLYLASGPGHGLYAAKEQLGRELETLLVRLFSQRSQAERFSAAQGAENAALLALYEAVYERYRVRMGASLLAPPEIERRALLLVRTSGAVARLAQRYQVVLVDEFQDVNPLQGRFFEGLEQHGLATEVVGDPKQSIYGFRNADVEVFRRALARGEPLEPLSDTRRHASVLARFLNHMTRTLASEGRGFGPEEAPEVQPAGPQAQVKGRVELHWVLGEVPIGDLRTCEASVLAGRLKALHEELGIGYSDMAVLARSYAGLAQVEAALLGAGLPYVLLQGRGYYERTELRDLYHALQVGIDPSGLSLGAWLRSPFAQLQLRETDRILTAEAPLKQLQLDFPEVHARLEKIRAQVRGTPAEALKFLIRTPFIGDQRYVDYLDWRARENVDALLFTVAEQPPGDIEILLERLDLLSRQADAGDVPQSGEGIALLTVHRAKGLEWRAVGVFDLGRMNYTPPEPLYVDPENGQLSVRDSGSFEALRDKVKARSEQESYRLLYVAASRAREVLVMSGSVKAGKCEGWAEALSAMNLGPGAEAYTRPDFVLQHWPYQPVSLADSGTAGRPGLEPSPWLDRVFSHHPYPPVYSPSRLKEDDHEPLPLPDPEEGELLPGRARAVGTLVHYAISQYTRKNGRAEWLEPSRPQVYETLVGQEVMFPFDKDERESIMQDVSTLLEDYRALLGRKLPSIAERDEDYPELPMALPHGATVWQGVIDRLYRVGEVWYLEDYKTDQQVNPERYHVQLAVYLQAIRQVRRVTPQVQLVFLRKREVVVVPAEALTRAFAQLDASTSPAVGLRGIN